MLVEIDEVAVERELWLRVKAGDPAARAEVRTLVNGLGLSMHALYLPRDKDFEIVTLRQLSELNLVDYVRCETFVCPST